MLNRDIKMENETDNHAVTHNFSFEILIFAETKLILCPDRLLLGEFILPALTPEDW